MRRSALAAVGIISLGGCGTVQPEVQTMGKYASERPVQDGWQPSEQIVTPRAYSKSDDTSPVRVGRTSEGYEYKIHAEGFASLRESASDISKYWSISCLRDKMDDKRRCKINNYDIGIDILFNSSGIPSQICIINHTYPGRIGSIRFDKSAPIQTDSEGCVPGGHLSSMLKAHQIVTRSVKWPYDRTIDREGYIGALPAAFSLCNFIRMRIDHISFQP